jgi:hypothetical protein
VRRISLKNRENLKRWLSWQLIGSRNIWSSLNQFVVYAFESP